MMISIRPRCFAAFHELRGEVNKLLVKGLSKQTKRNVLEDLKKIWATAWVFFRFLQRMEVWNNITALQ